MPAGGAAPPVSVWTPDEAAELAALLSLSARDARRGGVRKGVVRRAARLAAREARAAVAERGALEARYTAAVARNRELRRENGLE